MRSSHSDTRDRLCWLGMASAVVLCGCSSLLQPISWLKPRQPLPGASTTVAPAMLMNQIQFAEQTDPPLKNAPILSSTVGAQGALQQIGHSEPQHGGGKSSSAITERLQRLEGKLDQILIDLTRLEESLTGPSDSMLTTPAAARQLATVEQQLDGVLRRLTPPQRRVSQSATGHPELVPVPRQTRAAIHDQGWMFGQPASSAIADRRRASGGSNGAPTLELQAIEKKLDQILNQLLGQPSHPHTTTHISHNSTQVAAIENKLNRILSALGTGSSDPTQRVSR